MQQQRYPQQQVLEQWAKQNNNMSLFKFIIIDLFNFKHFPYCFLQTSFYFHNSRLFAELLQFQIKQQSISYVNNINQLLIAKKLKTSSHKSVIPKTMIEQNKKRYTTIIHELQTNSDDVLFSIGFKNPPNLLSVYKEHFYSLFLLIYFYGEPQHKKQTIRRLKERQQEFSNELQLHLKKCVSKCMVNHYEYEQENEDFVSYQQKVQGLQIKKIEIAHYLKTIQRLNKCMKLEDSKSCKCKNKIRIEANIKLLQFMQKQMSRNIKQVWQKSKNQDPNSRKCKRIMFHSLQKRQYIRRAFIILFQKQNKLDLKKDMNFFDFAVLAGSLLSIQCSKRQFFDTQIIQFKCEQFKQKQLSVFIEISKQMQHYRYIKKKQIKISPNQEQKSTDYVQKKILGQIVFLASKSDKFYETSQVQQFGSQVFYNMVKVEESIMVIGQSSNRKQSSDGFEDQYLEESIVNGQNAESKDWGQNQFNEDIEYQDQSMVWSKNASGDKVRIKYSLKNRQYQQSSQLIIKNQSLIRYDPNISKNQNILVDLSIGKQYIQQSMIESMIESKITSDQNKKIKYSVHSSVKENNDLSMQEYKPTLKRTNSLNKNLLGIFGFQEQLICSDSNKKKSDDSSINNQLKIIQQFFPTKSKVKRKSQQVSPIIGQENQICLSQNSVVNQQQIWVGKNLQSYNPGLTQNNQLKKQEKQVKQQLLLSKSDESLQKDKEQTKNKDYVSNQLIDNNDLSNKVSPLVNSPKISAKTTTCTDLQSPLIYKQNGLLKQKQFKDGQNAGYNQQESENIIQSQSRSQLIHKFQNSNKNAQKVEICSMGKIDPNIIESRTQPIDPQKMTQQLNYYNQKRKKQNFLNGYNCLDQMNGSILKFSNIKHKNDQYMLQSQMSILSVQPYQSSVLTNQLTRGQNLSTLKKNFYTINDQFCSSDCEDMDINQCLSSPPTSPIRLGSQDFQGHQELQIKEKIKKFTMEIQRLENILHQKCQKKNNKVVYKKNQQKSKIPDQILNINPIIEQNKIQNDSKHRPQQIKIPIEEIKEYQTISQKKQKTKFNFKKRGQQLLTYPTKIVKNPQLQKFQNIYYSSRQQKKAQPIDRINRILKQKGFKPNLDVNLQQIQNNKINTYESMKSINTKNSNAQQNQSQKLTQSQNICTPTQSLVYRLSLPHKTKQNIQNIENEYQKYQLTISYAHTTDKVEPKQIKNGCEQLGVSQRSNQLELSQKSNDQIPRSKPYHTKIRNSTDRQLSSNIMSQKNTKRQKTDKISRSNILQISGSFLQETGEKWNTFSKPRRNSSSYTQAQFQSLNSRQYQKESKLDEIDEKNYRSIN